MIFLDGVGIGRNDIDNNPFIKYGFKTFHDIFGAVPVLGAETKSIDSKILFPVDACMDVEGLPQSGTGQTAIFCGMNASKYIGKHFGPFPYSTLIPVIEKESIFQYCRETGKRAFFANAYPHVFFDYLNKGRSRLSVTSLSYRSAGYYLNTVEQVLEGKALTAEITGERWNMKLGYSLPHLTGADAGRRLLNISQDYDFTLYEYFLTDHAGHGRDVGGVEHVLRILDDFLYTVLTEHNEEMTVFICSDHGNVEDLSTKSHTTNPALCIASGKYADVFYNSVKSLPDIKSSILFCMNN